MMMMIIIIIIIIINFCSVAILRKLTNLKEKLIKFCLFLGCMKRRCCRIFSVDCVTKFSLNQVIIFAGSISRLVIVLIEDSISRLVIVLIGTSPVLYEKLKVLYKTLTSLVV